MVKSLDRRRWKLRCCRGECGCWRRRCTNAAKAAALLFWQGESDVDAAGRRLGIFAAACSNDYKLAAIYCVGCRGGIAGKGKSGFPEELACGFVEGVKLFVKTGGADEEQSTRSYNRTAIVF